jgi:hypothetical protein
MSLIVTSCVLAGFSRVIANGLGCGLLSTDVRGALFDMMNVGSIAPLSEIYARQNWGQLRFEKFYILISSAKTLGDEEEQNASEFNRSEKGVSKGLSA